MLCGIIKTIGVIVAFVSFIAFLALVAVNITPQTIIDFLAGVFLIFLITFVAGNLFMKIYRSCEVSNQKRLAKNVNHTAKKRWINNK